MSKKDKITNDGDKLPGNRLTQDEVDKLQISVSLLGHFAGVEGPMKDIVNQIEKNLNLVLWTAAPMIQTDLGIITRTPPYFIEDEG
jgi:hypothetical protein